VLKSASPNNTAHTWQRDCDKVKIIITMKYVNYLSKLGTRHTMQRKSQNAFRLIPARFTVWKKNAGNQLCGNINQKEYKNLI